MDKIIVNICVGQFGYTEGARLFKELGLVLSAKMKSQVQLTASDYDEAAHADLAPCVKVNDQLITQATAGDVVRVIQQTLKEKKAFEPVAFAHAV